MRSAELGSCVRSSNEDTNTGSGIRRMRDVRQGSHLPLLPVVAALVVFSTLASCSERVFTRQTFTIPKTEAQKGYIVFLALWSRRDERFR